MTQSPAHRWRILGLSSALIAAAFLAYANTFRVPFLFDDRDTIVDNLSIRDVGNLRQVFAPKMFSVLGRPVLNLSFSANYRWSGLGVWSYHLINLTVHILAGLTLFGVARRSLLSPRLRERFGESALWIAAVIAAIWTLHPLQTESVTYISERAESLMGLFYLLTLYGFVRCAEEPSEGQTTGRSSWACLSVLACLGGMATKEVMVSAPLVVLLYDRAFFGESFRGALAKRRWLYAGLGLGWVLLAFLLATAPLKSRGIGFHFGIDPATYSATECRVVVDYIKLAFWPHPLVFDYGTNVRMALGLGVLPYALAVAAAVAAAVVAWRRSKPVGFLAGSFFLLLAPTSSIVPVGMQPMAENRMYLPLAALVGLTTVAAYSRGGRKALAGLALVAVILGCLTARRNRDYRSAASIWEDTAAKTTSARAYSNLGDAIAKIPGRKAEAIADYRKALGLTRNYPEAHLGLANALFFLPGGLPHAIAHYRRAILLNPDYFQAHNNLALALSRTPGHLPEAIIQFNEALRLRPDDARSHLGLANALADTPGRLAEAIGQYESALRLEPNNAETHNNLAAALAKVPGRRTEALGHLETAHRLEPSNPQYLANLVRLKSALK